MVELADVPELDDPMVIAAFEGWNDAGEAASGVVRHLVDAWDAVPIAELEPDEYYDFQATRPLVEMADGESRALVWPTTRLLWARTPAGRDVLIVHGIEPNLRWRAFCAELLGPLLELGARRVVLLGALLADVPHTRPVPVTGAASRPGVIATLNLEPTRYEGPTGIVGVLQEAAGRAGLDTVSLWASVPHYVAQPPSPKATLALVRRVEELLDVTVPLGDLAEDARAWEHGVNELAEEDDEVADYVRTLEAQRDATDLPEASGDAIARDFARYLRRRDPG